ncbi:PP2C family protein-serine/threonine phosphatase [Desulfotalea psychrophila]|uniref:Related to sigma factor SigB regulation protein (RsbU) n=1 Tax=Desulfotalea psychrophila (strain LSv54 / DSM 12343) TaxID=177439 RepID=Q6ARC6_DESPS|nr:SpoIIE family protein phosphatase [Desulfotalea psychrophila]CAG35098.1 related to sigma factor SigB regulation protein (RsbU) [Desulfotalea psychrophila LSv54]
MRMKTLQQRTAILVLLPTFLLLIGMGWGGYIFTRQSLMTLWSETAIANLQRAAHLIDMRISQPKSLLWALEHSSRSSTFQFTLDQLRELEGVDNVRVEGESVFARHRGPSRMGLMGGMDRSGELLDFADPVYRWDLAPSTISIIMDFSKPEGEKLGNIRVDIGITDLMRRLKEMDRWVSNSVFLIDGQGNVVAHSGSMSQSPDIVANRRFGSGKLLERETFSLLQQELYGTVFGEGNPPKEIAGFYQLSDLPLSLVVIAPGEEMLQPVVRFSFFYILAFTLSLLLILAFIRSATAQITDAVKSLSGAAENLANGVFGEVLPVKSDDEIGELTKNFNKMTRQLRQGLELQKAMEIAREVQQTLLPDSRYSDEALTIFASTHYCNETGGDFYDLIFFDEDGTRVGAIVGDVVGHGIGAALLMATIRAMLRTRSEQSGRLDEIMNDVNRVLCRDTVASSNFVTLFYLIVDKNLGEISWVRAGHDPAWLYTPESDIFAELKGAGIAMGVAESFRYHCNTIDMLPQKQLLVIGSDGAWEAQNALGEMFGKDRVKDVLSAHKDESPEEITEAINGEIGLFMDGIAPQDDITFIVMSLTRSVDL